MPRPRDASARRFLLRLPGLFVALVLASCAALLAEEEPKPAVPALEGAELESVLESAETALAEENYGAARQRFGRVLVTHPEHPRARLGLAEVYMSTGRLDQALSTFKALEEEPAVRARALQGGGLGLLFKGSVEEATGKLEQAVDEDPGLWRAWNALGRAYDLQNEWKRAAECYAKALAAKPGSAIVLNNTGVSLLMQKEYARAAEAFSKALQVEPDFEQAEANLRLALAWQGKYRQAVAGANRRDLPSILNNAGYVAILRGDYERAEALLHQAMEASPSFNDKAWENIQYLETIKSMQRSQAENSDAPR